MLSVSLSISIKLTFCEGAENTGSERVTNELWVKVKLVSRFTDMAPFYLRLQNVRMQHVKELLSSCNKSVLGQMKPPPRISFLLNLRLLRTSQSTVIHLEQEGEEFGPEQLPFFFND